MYVSLIIRNQRQKTLNMQCDTRNLADTRFHDDFYRMIVFPPSSNVMRINDVTLTADASREEIIARKEHYLPQLVGDIISTIACWRV